MVWRQVMVLLEILVRHNVVLSIRACCSLFLSHSRLLPGIARLVLQPLQFIVKVDDVEYLLISKGSVFIFSKCVYKVILFS